jgi:hypothetical protein
MEGRAAFAQSLAAVTSKLSSAESRRLIAICVAIYSAPFWKMLCIRGKLSAEEAREAAASALEAVIAAAKTIGKPRPTDQRRVHHDHDSRSNNGARKRSRASSTGSVQRRRR